MFKGVKSTFTEKGMLRTLRLFLEKADSRRVLVVHGRNSYKLSGAKDIFDPIFKEMDMTVRYFSSFSPNPTFDELRRGVARVARFYPDVVIAIGGGSALDMGKLLRFFFLYRAPNFPYEPYIRNKRRPVPLLAIPTTAGTGSEATQYGLIVTDKGKYSISHRAMLPDKVILYAPFTFSQPVYLSACTGFDAFAQGVESMWSDAATEKSFELAWEAAFMTVVLVGYAMWNSHDERELVQRGAYLAGRAIQITKTTAPHACSYYFTTRYGIPHGHAVALTFPYFAGRILCQDNKSRLPEERRRKILAAMNLRSELSQWDIEDWMSEHIRKEFRLPTPRILDFSKEEFIASVDPEKLKTTPIDIDLEDLAEYLDQRFKNAPENTSYS